MSRLRDLLFGGAHTCPARLSWTLDNPLRRLLHDPIAILDPYVREGHRVLDLGAGSGYFTIALCSLAGERGQVWAADIQESMLERVRRRADRRGCRNLRLHTVSDQGLGLDGRFDFVLMFAMLHEVADQGRLLTEVRAVLRDDGAVLLAEPVGHVRRQAFERELEVAGKAGLIAVDRPGIALSHAAVLRTAG